MTAGQEAPAGTRESWDLVTLRQYDDFETFARARMGDLLRYATALTGDPHQGADVVQEVLVRASSRWRRIRLTARPDLYVKRMITNEHLSWRRRWHTRTVVATDDAALHALAPTHADPAAGVADRDDVRRRLASLTPRQRTVLVLRYYEGMDDADISQVLGLAPSTVRSTAARALLSLRADATPEDVR
ncbi:SigE family RNA polymerase sigma factor [Cellulomonas carbonis]|uniref:SigE family RNA polymerase sigma factor n=1 Tax=Cellulomonas carbonis TaxID=1386092 RepID=UPI00069472F9|nr:SigE family RNA polymerase sigma factor [Cellulomonas carbonis]